MAHYLVVAHGLSDPHEIAACAARIFADDRAAACTLLVTATDWARPISGHTPTLEAAALARGVAAREALRLHGRHFLGVSAGDGSAAVAVEDELRRHPDRYDAVVICTPRARGFRGWLEGDLRAHIQQRVPLPVFHLFEGASSPWSRDPRPRVGWLSRLWDRTRLASGREDALVPTRRQLLPFFLLMALYLLGGLSLAILVNRGFLLNDFVALIVYSIVLGGLLVVLRHEA
jgi:hypothetical protein